MYFFKLWLGKSVTMSLSLDFRTHKIGSENSFKDDQKQPWKTAEHSAWHEDALARGYQQRACHRCYIAIIMFCSSTL